MRRAWVITVAASTMLSAPARAADIPVTTTADVVAGDGRCSLREAVSSANDDTGTGGCQAGDGADRVLVPAGTYVLANHGSGEDGNQTGDLDVTETVTLTGSGTIDGDGADRVIDGRVGGLTVEGLTIRNGRLPAAGAGLAVAGSPGQDAKGGDGGAGASGGGIRALAALTLRDCRIQANRAGDGGAGGDGTGGVGNGSDGGFGTGGAGGEGGSGGGVWAAGGLAVERCTFAGNRAGDGGAGGRGFGGLGAAAHDGGPAQAGIGGAGGSGGGLRALATLVITDSAFTANASGTGGMGGAALGGSGGNGAGSGAGGAGGIAYGGFGGYGGDGAGAAQGTGVPSGESTITRSTFAGGRSGAGGAGGSAGGGIGGTGGPSNGAGGPGGEARGGWGVGGSSAGFATTGKATATNVTFNDNVVPPGADGGASFGGIGGHGLGSGGGGAGGRAVGSRGGAGGYAGAFQGPELGASHATFWGGVIGGPGQAGQVVPGRGGAPGQTGGGTGAAGASTPGLPGDGARGRHVGAGTAVLRASLFGPGTGQGCTGVQAVVDGGGNVSTGDPSCPGTDAGLRLRPLADNGGPTPTMALEPGSPARDAVPAAGCPATDQRGFARPAGAACDAGAYEATSPAATTGGASAVGVDAATVAGSAVANHPAAVRLVEFGTSPAYGAASPEVPVSGGAFTVRLTGLRPATTYHYRVVARNPDGTATGADATFTTAAVPDTTPPKLSRISLEGRRLRFTLDEPARVAVRAQRCGAERRRRCAAWVITRRTTIAAGAGRTSRRLKRAFVKGGGDRRLTLVATDAAGNAGKAKRLRVR